MSCNDRHIAMEVGQHNAMPLVDICASDSGSPVIAPSVPADASSMVVKQVVSPVYIAKIAQAIVRPVVVNMVNILWLFAMSKKPSKAVGKQATPFVMNPYITVAVDGASCSHFTAANRLDAANDSSFRVIAKAFTNGIRNNLRSHIKPSFDVVRGAVVGATVTPILPSFASPGRRSGDNRCGPLFINPITLKGPEFTNG